MTAYSLTIGGKAAVTPRTFDVLNPADESVVAACPEGSENPPPQTGQLLHPAPDPVSTTKAPLSATR